MATRAYVPQLLEEGPDLVVVLPEVHPDGGAVTVRATWSGTRGGGPAWVQSGLALIPDNEAGQLTRRWSAYVPHG